MRLNISKTPSRIWRNLIAAVATLALVAGTFALTVIPKVSAADDRAALEQQLRDLEAQISQYESQIATYRKQGNSLKGEINSLNAKISKLNLQIRATQLTLSSLNLKIGETQNKIVIIQNDIENNKVTLSQLLRNLQAAEDTNIVEIFLRSQDLSDFVNDVNNMTSLQENLRHTINQITDLRNQLQDQKDQLVIARADTATLQQAQQSQKGETEQVKQEKNTLLQVTKGQESKYQQLVQQKKAQAAQIRARLFEFLGGGEMSFGAAYNLAKFAQDATGVRAAFLLAILDRESALGRNVGRCTYRQSMNPRDWNTFISITRSLGINPETQLVSCANADGKYGGAMGPAQFIPSTWQSYASRVTAITGRPVANPWNNSDAFVASALYVKDGGALTNERFAAAKYYCGFGNWNRYVCTGVYGRRVVEKAAQFQEDIDAITS